jgi:segregation and condensation protein B
MANLEAKIEALLAVSPRPLDIKKLAELTGAEKDEVRQAVATLGNRLREAGSGVAIMHIDDEVRMGSSPETTETVKAFIKDETTGELTRPQLETLTVIAYRGPVSKAELEQIRGVNCTMIIRNLLMRGLVEEHSENGVMQYSVSMEFMSFLGAASVAELPDYEMLRRDKRIEDILELAGKQEQEQV